MQARSVRVINDSLHALPMLAKIFLRSNRTIVKFCTFETSPFLPTLSGKSGNLLEQLLNHHGVFEAYYVSESSPVYANAMLRKVNTTWVKVGLPMALRFRGASTSLGP